MSIPTRFASCLRMAVTSAVMMFAVSNSQSAQAANDFLAGREGRYVGAMTKSVVAEISNIPSTGNMVAGPTNERQVAEQEARQVAEQEARRRVERMMNKPSPQAVAVALVINRSDRTWIVSIRFENPTRETALRDLKLEIDTLTGKAIDCYKG